MNDSVRRGFAAGLVLAVLAIGPAFAQQAVIDIAAMTQLIQQVAQGAQQLAALQTQLQNQTQMLQPLPSSIMPGVSPLTQQTQSLQGQLANPQSMGTALQSQFGTSYPGSYSSYSPQAMLAQVNAMTAANRQAIATSMEIQNQVAANQPALAGQVQNAVAASQGAAGPTAVAMATNQLLAAQSAQLADLQSLLIAAQRAQQQQVLQQQSETATVRAFNNLPTAIAAPQTFQGGFP